MGVLSFLGFTENKNEKAARKQFDQATAQERARTPMLDNQAAESRGRYTSLLEGYDPQKYLRESAGAVAEDLGEAYNQGEGQRALRAQRQGFIHSGGGAGALQRDFSGRLARAIAGLSLQAGQMEQGRIDRFGEVAGDDRAYAEGSRERGLDLVASERDRAIQSKNSRLAGTIGIAKLGAQAAAGGF